MKIDQKEVMTTNYEFAEYAHRLALPLVGVFNKDTLPQIPQDGCYLVNLQDDNDENGNPQFGTHWVCFYIEKKHACYFDSFGFIPPLQIRHFLKRYMPIAYSTKQVQNPRSHACGYYCLYFFWYMTRNKKVPLTKRFDMFMDLWSDDVSENQDRLKKYLLPL